MRHFDGLQTKIRQLESKQLQREQEIRELFSKSHEASAQQLQSETQKWRTLVDIKNKEIEVFRKELDAILEVLRELHKQGVLLPFSGTSNLGSMNSLAMSVDYHSNSGKKPYIS